MSNWLDKILPPPTRQGGTNLPSKDVWSSFLPPPAASAQGRLPNASLIYGIASAAIFGVGLYFLFTGMWLTGLFTMLPAVALLGYALHYLRYPV
jgi:hypothetical protein